MQSICVNFIARRLNRNDRYAGRLRLIVLSVFDWVYRPLHIVNVVPSWSVTVQPITDLLERNRRRTFRVLTSVVQFTSNRPAALYSPKRHHRGQHQQQINSSAAAAADDGGVSVWNDACRRQWRPCRLEPELLSSEELRFKRECEYTKRSQPNWISADFQ